MEQFSLLTGDQTLKSSREPLNNALLTVRSLSAGDAFPTTNLSVGMLCYRTDLARLYQLADEATQTWTDKLSADIAGTAAAANSVAWTNITAKPTDYPPASHTHLYAGSAQAGGAATSATRLSAARTINGTPFDGTADITIDAGVMTVNGQSPDDSGNLALEDYVSDLTSDGQTISATFKDGSTRALSVSPSYASSVGSATSASPAVVVKSYRSGTLWYRKYSDGFIEQGGQLTTNASANAVEFTFAVPFSDTNYSLSAQITDGTTSYLTAVTVRSKTATGITAAACQNANSWTGKTVSVYACGY